MDFGSLILLVIAVPLVLGVVAGVVVYQRAEGSTFLRAVLSVLTGAGTIVVVVAIAFAGCFALVSR